MRLDDFPEIGDTSFNPKQAVGWVHNQSPEAHSSLVSDIFHRLLQHASKPRQSSGNACTKLCGFVEQCSKSDATDLRDFAFSEDTALRLFNFFLEWNEQDAHKSMRTVLDLLVILISRNPDAKVGAAVRSMILSEVLSIITRQAARPSVKSAMVAIEHLLQKELVYLGEILETYKQLHGITPSQETLWDALVASIFAWMELQHVCPAAGKLIVTILTNPWYEGKENRHQPTDWHRFIYKGLQRNPDILEPLKYSVFVALFKVDRAGALGYLHLLSSLQVLTARHDAGWDLDAILWLNMLEAGKKTGVVGEPGQSNEAQTSAQLDVNVLKSVLGHESHQIRSSGLAILVVSPSTTRPYTTQALELLKEYLPCFHEDSDAKFRYELLSHSRNMIKRIQGAAESMRKEHGRALKRAGRREADVANIWTSSADVDYERDERRRTWEVVVSHLHFTISRHDDFVRWYVHFLKHELVPTASYQRHITALKAMDFIFKFDSTTTNQTPSQPGFRDLLVDATWFRAVLDLTVDPFDDVREGAASLVRLLGINDAVANPPNHIRGLHDHPLKVLEQFGKDADDLSQRTGRADQADGVARVYELLYRWSPKTIALEILSQVLKNLEAKLSVAENDLATAVLQTSVHGNFASLCYIWSSLSTSKYSDPDLNSLEQLQDRAIECCRRIWDVVRHVLCDDSPEGHMPEEFGEVDGLDTKDVLSYSFRAIYESSNLLHAIIKNSGRDRNHGSLTPTRKGFEVIGRLLFDELSNLRHRGAFSAVSQTFAICCQNARCFTPQPSAKTDLLEEWYQGALDCIFTQASTTRRSAGIPNIIVGILSSNSERTSFESVIRNLQEIASRPARISETDGSNLPQVHALNCLKDIYKSSQLNDKAEVYLTACLQLAADSLKSEVWAIRNCGLLLLRSLIDCVLPTNDSKASIEVGWDGRSVRIAYHRYEALPNLLVNLLELGQATSGVVIGSQTAESVFPALDIIRRAGPPETLRDKLYDLVAYYLGSRIWHVREIAARTLCTFLLRPGWIKPIEELLTSSKSSANALHGVLLTLRFLLPRLFEVLPEQLSSGNIEALCDVLTSFRTSESSLQMCSEAMAVYLDISTFLSKPEVRNMSEAAVDLQEVVYNELASIPQTLNPQVHHQSCCSAPVGLLKLRLGEAAVRRAALQRSKDVGTCLIQTVNTALHDDINVGCIVLQAMSRSDDSGTQMSQTSFLDTYIQVCLNSVVLEPRTMALENLASAMVSLLGSSLDDPLQYLPSREILSKLWLDLQLKPLNPSLADAIIRVSGPILAIIVLRAEGNLDGDDSLTDWVRSWGLMMSDAGRADKTFDTRQAAVFAMNSISLIIEVFAADDIYNNATSACHPAHISWLLALYDALNDDDDEIREAASLAAAPILGTSQALVSVEAGSRLLKRLGQHFGNRREFRAHVASRTIGHYHSPSFTGAEIESSALIKILFEDWIPADVQIAEAMQPDDALFVTEEQNLYIDEVREARRWSEVFVSCHALQSDDEDEDVVFQALCQWTLAGLGTLTRIAESQVDGPLGWTSKPQVFAICARIVISASALAATARNTDAAEGDGGQRQVPAVLGAVAVRDGLRKFWDVGRSDASRVNGLLLLMCGFE